MLALFGGGLFGGNLFGGALFREGITGLLPTAGWQAVGPPIIWQAGSVGREWQSVGAGRVWKAGGHDVGQLVRNVVQKAPGDAVILYCDFGECPQLVAGAVISSCLIVEVTTTALTITGKTSDDYRAWAKFSGGVDGTDYLIKFTATLDSAETIERTTTLQVRT